MNKRLLTGYGKTALNVGLWVRVAVPGLANKAKVT
jgi:hypothetical protein